MSLLSDEWGTPLNCYRFLNKRYSFVADMAASDKNHLHETYYTRKRSALAFRWAQRFGRRSWVYVNPPYSRKEVGKWFKKCHDEWMDGLSIVMLAKCGDGEHYWDDYVINKASEVCDITGRLEFRHHETLLPAKGCNFGSRLVIWDAEKKDAWVEEHPGLVIKMQTLLTSVKKEEFDVV